MFMENFDQPLDLIGLDKYYHDEFTKIHDSHGTYKGKWNWWAFFFTTIWCLTKGLWVIAILSLLTVSYSFYRHEISHGIFINIGFYSGIIWSILLGWRGTWFYYNAKIYKKQLPTL